MAGEYSEYTMYIFKKYRVAAFFVLLLYQCSCTYSTLKRAKPDRLLIEPTGLGHPK
jgi:hypothetical protein